MKVRVKFTKEGEMKFIGHLDLMRYFQKAFRRADIDIAYSAGFSPHQQLSFASPLGVGLTSKGEYMDLVVNSTFDSKTMINLLNVQMVDGISILSWKKIEDETKRSNAMSILIAADYLLSFQNSSFWSVDTRQALQNFLAQEEIAWIKKTKKGEKAVNLREMIHDWHFEEEALFLRVHAGSSENLKPETVIEAFCASRGIEYQPFSFQVCRLEMYAQDQNGELISLDDLGTDIYETIGEVICPPEA